MASPAYFDWNYWTPLVGAQGAEFLKNLYDRAGGDQTATTNLVDINTSITDISNTVDSLGESAPASFKVEIDRLRLKVKELESLIDGR